MALKIVYKICCGIDVHKTFVVACIANTNNQGVTTYDSHRFSTYTRGLPLIHGSMKKKLPELELAIDGFITPEQAGKLKVIKEHLKDLESRKTELGKR